ncbi:hypothetical protein FOZ62_026150 [Perkinsus olseni]|uniref:Uncharacterized protein n=1 Tax=Perkinsus olseni TaxID=32597 RepID=A0A7J6RSA7_PEROL|nr:hypothetical protein FOZ62_026150 [Perkinsus olseni]
MDPDHVAFDPQCYDEEVAKIRSAKESMLREAAAKLNKDYKNLTASEAVAAMLQVQPPNCPLKCSGIITDKANQGPHDIDQLEFPTASAMAGTGSDSDKIDYDDHPFTVLSVEDSILRLPFYMGEEFADESTDDPRGSGVELSLMDVTTGS